MATLKWQWVAGLGASERRFDEVAVRAARSGADLVGARHRRDRGDPALAALVARTITDYGARGTPIRAVMLARLGPTVWHWVQANFGRRWRMMLPPTEN